MPFGFCSLQADIGVHPGHRVRLLWVQCAHLLLGQAGNSLISVFAPLPHTMVIRTAPTSWILDNEHEPSSKMPGTQQVVLMIQVKSLV